MPRKKPSPEERLVQIISEIGLDRAIWTLNLMIEIMQKQTKGPKQCLQLLPVQDSSEKK